MIANILFCALFICGIYLLYSELCAGASAGVVSAVALTKVHGYSQWYSYAVDTLAVYLVKLVYLPENRQSDYSKMLSALEMPYTPAMYIARILSQCIFYAVIGLVLYPVSPLLLLLSCAFAVYTYNSEVSGIRKKYQQRREEIELELPKLCSVINSKLQSTSNAQSILQSFLPISGAAMAQELRITIKDMQTGNPENALRRMELRVGSSKVSDVIRGLISVHNGDNQSVYFLGKQQQLNDDYRTVKKKNISKRPTKLILPGMLIFLFFCCIAFYPVVLIMQQYTNTLF